MSTALHTLLDHAERQRDAGLAAVQRAELAARQQRQQAQQLQQYREEYRLRNPLHNGRSAPIDALRGHQAFMDRLQQALGQQLAQVAAAEATLARQRSVLLALEVRLASVQKLLQRRQHEQLRVADRREQQRTDEAAAQQLWRAALAQSQTQALADADTLHSAMHSGMNSGMNSEMNSERPR